MSRVFITDWGKFLAWIKTERARKAIEKSMQDADRVVAELREARKVDRKTLDEEITI